MQFRGLYTALVTPFDKDLNINIPSYKNLLQLQLKAGVAGVVPLGTTGESPTITKKERTLLITTTVEELKGKRSIIVGTGSYSTQDSIENTKQAQDLGADAALIVTPYYNKPTSEGIFRHFEAIAKNTKLPIIVYNIQGRTGRNIDTATLRRLAEIPNIVGVKEASGNIDQMVEVIDTITRDRPDFSILSGDDALTLPLIALGGVGVISVVSNLLPQALRTLVDAALAGNGEVARKAHFELLPIFKGAFIETNPIPIKAAMNLCGFDVGGYRLPLCEMTKENHNKLEKILREMKLL